jgi:hypothetical protein
MTGGVAKDLGPEVKLENKQTNKKTVPPKKKEQIT